MHKNRLFSLLLIIVIAISSSSCINLVNHIVINKDKSGTAFIGIEINALSGLINTNTDELDKDSKDKIMNFTTPAMEKIKGIDGISNIKSSGLLKLGKYGLKFSFKNAKALNTAYYRLLDMDYKWYSPAIIKIRNHSVKVKDVSSQIKEYIAEDDSEFLSPTIIEYLNIATIIEVPNNITSVKMDMGETSYNGKTINVIIPLKSVLKEDASVGFKFNY